MGIERTTAQTRRNVGLVRTIAHQNEIILLARLILRCLLLKIIIPPANPFQPVLKAGIRTCFGGVTHGRCCLWGQFALARPRWVNGIAAF
jgi:hypothetical protein